MSSSVGEIGEIREAIEQIGEDNLEIAKLNAILLLNKFEDVVHEKLDAILELTKEMQEQKQ